MRIFFLMLLVSSPAWGACKNLRVAVANATVDLTPNTAPSINLTVSRSGGNSCNYFVTIDYGAASSFGGRKLVQSGGYEIPVNIYRDSAHTQILKKVPDAGTASDVISGSFPQGSNPGSVTHTYYPMLGTLAYNRFGTYSDTFTVAVYEYTGSYSGTPTDTDTVKLQYTMAKKIDLSLMASGAPFNAADTVENMNFGVLSAGAVRGFDIGVKYNAGYRVRVSSLNEGRLKHASLSDTVPYTLAVNSAAVSLAGSNTTPVQVATGSGVSAANGTILTSSVTIGALGTARAGNYSDTVTITVSTTE